MHAPWPLVRLRGRPVLAAAGRLRVVRFVPAITSVQLLLVSSVNRLTDSDESKQLTVFVRALSLQCLHGLIPQSIAFR